MAVSGNPLVLALCRLVRHDKQRAAKASKGPPDFKMYTSAEFVKLSPMRS
jgi:hypothetical protein